VSVDQLGKERKKRETRRANPYFPSASKSFVREGGNVGEQHLGCARGEEGRKKVVKEGGDPNLLTKKKEKGGRCDAPRPGGKKGKEMRAAQICLISVLLLTEKGGRGTEASCHLAIA